LRGRTSYRKRGQGRGGWWEQMRREIEERNKKKEKGLAKMSRSYSAKHCSVLQHIATL